MLNEYIRGYIAHPLRVFILTFDYNLYFIHWDRDLARDWLFDWTAGWYLNWEACSDEY